MMAASTRHSSIITIDQQPAALQRDVFRALMPLLTTILITTATPPLAALAENVRVEDVTNSTLRAGLEAANEGRLDAAEKFFKAYIAQEDNSSASGFSNLGNVHLQQGKTQLALEDFTKAVDLAGPGAAVPILNRSIAYEQLGVDEEKQGRKTTAAEYYQKALSDCDAATAADPKEFAAWFDKGNVQMRLEDYTAALDSFNKAADLAAIPGYRLRAATLQYQTGNIAKAKQTMRGIIRKNSNYAEARAALAAVNWAEGNVDVAEELLASAEDLDGALWKDIDEVKELTRWPPALYDAYSRLLKVVP